MTSTCRVDHVCPDGQASCGTCDAPARRPATILPGVLAQRRLSGRPVLVAAVFSLLFAVVFVGFVGAMRAGSGAGPAAIDGDEQGSELPGASLAPDGEVRTVLIGAVRVRDFGQIGRFLQAEAGCSPDRADSVECAQAKLDGLQALVEGRTRSCSNGVGGAYGDIRAGADVVVRNSAGTVLATAALQDGTLSAEGCVLELNVPDVPSADGYRISVAGRDPLSRSFAQLQERNWIVDLNL
jgi:hypothetical protein